MRRELSERYGEQKLYEGGLSVRTTLDPKIQLMARKALVDGLVRYDEAYGWHGTLKTIDISQDWGVPLADIPAYGDIKPWVMGVALNVGDAAMRIGIQPERDKSGAIIADRKTGSVTLNGALNGRAEDLRVWLNPATSFTSSLLLAAKENIGCDKFRKCPAPASPWIRLPGACSPWSADFRLTGLNSIARPRRSASRAPHSSRSSMRRRSCASRAEACGAV